VKQARRSIRPPAHSDPELAGCLAAFERELDYVLRTLRRYGVGGAEVEDLAQEVFLVMWQRWSHFDQQRPVRPWLGGIIFRLVSHHWRRALREIPSGPLMDTAVSGDPEEDLTAQRARRLVLEAMAGVPARHRAVLVLFELEGVPISEIAQMTSTPLSTVYSRLRVARKAFGKVLRRLQLRRGPPGSLPPAALLALERPIPRAPPSQKQRALRAARSLTPPAPRPRARPRGLAAPLGVAILTVAAALVVVGVWPRRSSAPVAPAAGPTAYWRFDEGQGSLRVRDRSGHGTDCTLHDIDPATRWLTPGLWLGPGWVECPRPALDPGRDLTVSAWIQRLGVRRGFRAVVHRQAGEGRHDHFFFGFFGEKLMLTSDLWDGRVSASVPIPDGRWFHVTGVHDGTRGEDRLYVDGIEVARAEAGAGAPAELAGPVTIGGGINGPDPTVTSQHFHGAVAEVLLYDRALDAAEVRALAARGGPGSSRGTR
jgi:RNA polymerase sigma-70 factor (ECF subfamily)